MRRTVCDKSVDTDRDDLADCTEFSLQTEAHNPDTDGDGLTDGEEVLTYKTDPRNLDSDRGGVSDGTEIAAGTNANDPSDDGPSPTPACDDGAPQGTVGAHYDADLAMAASPDPDFFDWDLSAVWCVKDGVVVIRAADALGAVTLDRTIDTALELIGVNLREDIDDDDRYVVRTAGTTGSVTASTDFDVCVAPLQLLFPSGGLKRLADPFLSRAIGRFPRRGTVEAWMDKVTLRLDRSLYEMEERLLTVLERKLRRNTLIPDGLEIPLRKRVTKQVKELREAMNRPWLDEWADTGFARFLDVYGEGKSIRVRRDDREAARKLWKKVVGDFVEEGASHLAGLLKFEVCSTVWRPILTIYVPRFGESFVSDEDIDGSIFDVKGGIVQDDRSTVSH